MGDQDHTMFLFQLNDAIIPALNEVMRKRLQFSDVMRVSNTRWRMHKISNGRFD